MTPELNPVNNEQRYYHKAHKKTRSKVERCIGLLKQRFRCLLGERKLLYSHERAADIIISCVVLHNFLMTHFGELVDEVDVDAQPVENVEENNDNEQNAGRRNYLNAGRDVRNRLAHQLFANQQENLQNPNHLVI